MTANRPLLCRTSWFDRNCGNDGNRRIFPIAAPSGEGQLSEPTAVAQPWPREPLLMPHSSHLAAATGVLSAGWEAEVERSRRRGSASCFFVAGTGRVQSLIFRQMEIAEMSLRVSVRHPPRLP